MEYKISMIISSIYLCIYCTEPCTIFLHILLHNSFVDNKLKKKPSTHTRAQRGTNWQPISPLSYSKKMHLVQRNAPPSKPLSLCNLIQKKNTEFYLIGGERGRQPGRTKGAREARGWPGWRDTPPPWSQPDTTTLALWFHHCPPHPFISVFENQNHLCA